MLRQLVAVGEILAMGVVAGLAGRLAAGPTPEGARPVPARSPILTGEPVPVNDPIAAEDSISAISGASQTDPSVAWCGRNVLVGFEDAGSYVKTDRLGDDERSRSALGWARSTDAGASYVDRGALVPQRIEPGGRLLLSAS